METWLVDMPKSAMRSKLHGWALWSGFCEREGTTAKELKEDPSPVTRITDFICDMHLEGASESWRREAMPAVHEIFGALGIIGKLSENAFIRAIARSCTTAVKRQSKYREIWDLGILLDYLRSEGPPDRLNWSDLMRRTAAIFMIFVPLRPAAMLRLDPTTEKASKVSESIEVQTCDKTDSRRARTYIAIRPLGDKRLCPLTHYRLLVQGAKERGLKDALWSTKEARPL